MGCNSSIAKVSGFHFVPSLGFLGVTSPNSGCKDNEGVLQHCVLK